MYVITHAETRIARNETPGVNISQKPDILRNQIFGQQGVWEDVGAGRGLKLLPQIHIVADSSTPLPRSFCIANAFFVHFLSYSHPPFMSH